LCTCPGCVAGTLRRRNFTGDRTGATTPAVAAPQHVVGTGGGLSAQLVIAVFGCIVFNSWSQRLSLNQQCNDDDSYVAPCYASPSCV